MIKWMKRQAIDMWDSQWVDHTNVVPRQRWSDVDRSFHLVSPAGHIIYKPKSQKEVTEFRDKYINRFECIEKDALNEKDRNCLFFYLYQEIRRDVKRARYKANIRTRFKGRVCSLIK